MTIDDGPVLVLLAAGMAKRYGGGCKPLAPLGVQGEAVIDLTVGDARRAGFGDIVLVLGRQTGPAIEYHVERSWPSSVAVSFALQDEPLGTAHAVLSARQAVGDRPFAVVNGDDVYGADALAVLAAHLAAGGDEHALVGFRLADSVATDDPVTRGTCEVGSDGMLQAIAERRQVRRQADGSFRSEDGRQPVELDDDTRVSMNCWGLRSSIWPVLADAVRSEHPHVDAPGHVATSRSDRPMDGGAEVLLPEVVGAAIAPGSSTAPQRVRVLRGEGRCLGVTHSEDLPAVRAALASMVGQGLRPADPWEEVR